MGKIKGINFLDVEDRIKKINEYVSEDIFETHDEDQVNEFVTFMMKEKMKHELVLDKIRELISEYHLLVKYTEEDYGKTLQEINELLEKVGK